MLVFLRKKHQNSQKWAKFKNFSFWPFLWFGLPGRLLKQGSEETPQNESAENAENADAKTQKMRKMLRDCETTIKIKFTLFRGVGRGGREENCPKTLFFSGNAMTIKFWKVQLLLSRNFVVMVQAPKCGCWEFHDRL